MRLGCQVEANGVNLQHVVSPKKVERGIMVAQTLEVVAGVVSLGLTPVLLFSGIAGLFNVFATRLGRVSDQADALSEKFQGGRDIRLTRASVAIKGIGLRSRPGDSSWWLNLWRDLVLFLGELRNAGAANMKFLLFGGSIILAMGALAPFVVEILLAAHGIPGL
jgi:hypothetical protein